MSEHGRSVLVPLAYRIEDAAAAIGISRSTLFEHIKDGRIPSRKIGNSTVIRRCDLEAFLDAAPLSAATKAAQKANGNQPDPTALGQLGIRGADDGTAILPQASRSGAKTDTARSVVPFQTAARELGLSAATLRRMCRTGRGPTLLRLSERRLGIRRGDLDAWKANREMPVGRTHVPANDAGHKRSRRGS